MVFKVVILFLVLTVASRTNCFLDPVEEELEPEEKPRFVKSVFLPPIRRHHDVPTTTEMTLNVDESFVLEDLRFLFSNKPTGKPLRRGHGRPRSTTPRVRQKMKATTESGNVETVNQPRPSNSHVEQLPKIAIAVNKEEEENIGKRNDSKVERETTADILQPNLTHQAEFIRTPEDPLEVLVFEETPSKPSTSPQPVEINWNEETTLGPEIQSQQQQQHPEEVLAFIAEENEDVGQVSLEPTTFSPQDPHIFVEHYITTTPPMGSAPDGPTAPNVTAPPLTTTQELHESSALQNISNVVEESQILNGEESRNSALFTSTILVDEEREIATSPKPIVFRVKLKSEAIDVRNEEENENLPLVTDDVGTTNDPEQETTRIFIE